MRYKQGIEKFQDYLDFSASDPCVWIVYPAGAAGDLLASIVNFHYARTGAKFFGITDTGQVIFKDSNKKQFNKATHINQQLINKLNEKLAEENLNMSLLDQVIFSNHGWQTETIKNIINFFPNSKVIRILPKNNLENSIISWLSQYKNLNRLTDFQVNDTFNPIDNIIHDQVLELYFGDLLHKTKFETCYDQLVQHLDLDYKLVRFDFIKFWIDNQHPIIQPLINSLSS